MPGKQRNTPNMMQADAFDNILPTAIVAGDTAMPGCRYTVPGTHAWTPVCICMPGCAGELCLG